jgi:subtilisin family serine protease
MVGNKGNSGPLKVVALALVSLAMSATAWAESSRYIVTFKNSDRYQAASNTFRQSKRLAELGLATPSATTGMTLLNTPAQIVRALDNLEMMIVETDSEDVARMLAKHPAVADVEQEIFFPNPAPVNGYTVKDGYTTFARATECAVDSKPWGINSVKAEGAWSVTKGKGARVLVLDTGFDRNHPDLKSRFEKGRNFASAKLQNGIVVSSGTDDVTDKIGHGTHVAGTIAADGGCLFGVAPEAKILSGKVCEDRGCSTAAVVAGIDWGISEKVDVISMSLGGPLALPSQQRAVQRAEAANVSVVAASGNDGVRRISYPAAYDTVIAVGAIADTNKRAEFSQYGPGLDVVAPGVDVISSVPMGAGRLSNVSVDMGDGKTTRVKSVSFAGAPQNSTPVSGAFAFAGLGKTEDMQKSNVRGKFALIQRGEIPFKDKVMNAMNAGASGVVIFNNAEGLARGSLGEDGVIRIPVAMIEKAIGERIRDTIVKGTAVTASIVTEESDYDSFDGTSMACPHVSGVVALVRAANPKMTAAQVRDLLSKSATSIGSADEYGAGLVNAEAAVKGARSLAVENLASGF